jgi:hypothetical protein
VTQNRKHTKVGDVKLVPYFSSFTSRVGDPLVTLFFSKFFGLFDSAKIAIRSRPRRKMLNGTGRSPRRIRPAEINQEEETY